MSNQTPKPFAITLDAGSSLANHTGSWRTFKPVYVDRLPPCNETCPAGENIQAWLFRAEEGDYRGAWEEIVRNNPFPAIMGRACYHTCESACNRAHLDEAVGIHAVERFLGDQAIRYGWHLPAPTAAPSGKKVLVVGAGPGGLACAYHLTRLGHNVTVVDAAPQAGGMLRYGIPRYRLPRKVLDAEISRIVAYGVTVKLNTRIDDLAKAKAEGHYDAVFLATGAPLSRETPLSSDGSVKVMDALALLRAIETDGDRVLLGRRVAVYGGGNTAMDVARSAKRLGADLSLIVYRRDRTRMPAHSFEVKEAEEEGVVLSCLRTIQSVANGHLVLEKMVLNDQGSPIATGATETVAVETLVLALGQQIDPAPLTGIEGLTLVGDAVRVDNFLRTGHPGIYAGGDMVPSERTMTVAVGHGKKAARAIDAYLHGRDPAMPAKHEVASFDKLNAWYYADAPATVQPALDVIRRQSGFEEVLGNLDEDNARYEARRCLSCGNCFECDNCYGICPDNAITKLGPGRRFEFKYDYCKGCALCAAECPCGAIAIVAEDI